tara:strand:- start:5011 stop:5658 length:648 start_codon:yes stop_codon:yes gene_type:complete
MASRPGIDTSLVNRLGQDHSDLFYAVKMEFDSGTLRFWSGTGDFVLDTGASNADETYTGAGSLLTVSAIEDDTEATSKGMSLSLSGMNSTVNNYALTEEYQNRPITVYLGFMNGGEAVGKLVMFKGRMMNMTINDGPSSSTITLEAENRLLDLEKPSNYRYTKETQNELFAGDLGLNFVEVLQNAQLNWGPIMLGVAGGSYNVGNDGTNIHRSIK